MDVTTYIVDSFTLINGIHEIKRWVYDGYLRILIPTCTLQEVEQQYKASLAATEQAKENAAKKPPGRLPRREQPLFDINPRTALEFLNRANSWSKDAGVVFQKEGEEFGQWKEEEEAQKLKSPPSAPTSFVEALQSKILGPDAASTTSQGPTKPKLVPRSSETKAAWKLQRIPRIPSDSVPKNYKSFFSCVLWRLYEYENNPLLPEKFLIMADDARVKAVAASENLEHRERAQIREMVGEKTASLNNVHDGLLEKDFSSAMKARSPLSKLVKSSRADIDHVQNGVRDRNGPVAAYEGRKTAVPNSTEPNDSLRAVVNGLQNGHNDSRQSSKSPLPSPDATAGAQVVDILTAKTSDEPQKQALNSAQHEQPVSLGENAEAEILEKPREDDDTDSDEEVIVFNPRAKRLSGRPQTPAKPADRPKSRPVTAHGKSPSRSPSKPEPSHLTKSPIMSTLKPQSPVFTPGQLYTPALAAVQQPTQQTNTSQPNGILPHPAKTQAASTLANPAKSPSTKAVSGTAHSRPSSNGQVQRQQSEMIIKRQREAMQRQVKVAAKPPPRQVQMEPTDNPTIIDPDAFDRSYVVQQPSQPPQRGSARNRAGGKQRHSPRDGSRQAGRLNGDQDVDFVLKSGTPRGATRGKGKLWVP